VPSIFAAHYVLWGEAEREMLAFMSYDKEYLDVAFIEDYCDYYGNVFGNLEAQKFALWKRQ
jgi:hypothetical protein